MASVTEGQSIDLTMIKRVSAGLGLQQDRVTGNDVDLEARLHTKSIAQQCT